MKFYMRRNRHPFISGVYINGYIKDIPLRDKNMEQIDGDIRLMLNSCKFMVFF